MKVFGSERVDMRVLNKSALEAMQRLLSIAINQAQQGRYTESIEHLKQVLALDPIHSQALNVLAEIYRIQGHYDAALTQANLLLSNHFNFYNAEYYNTRGAIYNQMQRYAEAEADYLKAIQINKRYAPSYSNIINVYRALNQASDALKIYNKAVANGATSSDLYNNLGALFFGLGDYTQAEVYFLKALAQNPTNITAQENIAKIHSQKNDYAALLACFKQYDLYRSGDAALVKTLLLQFYQHEAINEIEKTVQYFTHHHSSQTVVDILEGGDGLNLCFYVCDYYKLTRQHEAGKKLFDQLNKIAPNNTAIINNYGAFEFYFASYQEALALFTQVTQLDSNSALAHRNAGACNLALGRTLDALNCYQVAHRANPADQHTIAQLLQVYLQTGLWDDFYPMREKLVQVMQTPQKDIIGSLQMLSLSESIAEQASFLQQAAKVFFKTHFLFDYSIVRQAKSKKIRLAYVSFDFRSHPVSYLTAELYGLHDRSKFEVHAYSYGINDNSDYRTRIQRGVDFFHEVSELSQIELANKIYADNIDILIDLTGNTQHTRSGIFAYKLASVQVHWLGYIATMGDACFDYIISDHFTTPESYDQFFAEKLVRMPLTLQVNDRQRKVSDKAMTRAEFGLPENAFVFCNFGQIFKIQPKLFASWMAILKATPTSVLWLAEQDPLAKNNLLKEVAKHNVDTARVIFACRLPVPEYLARYRLADLMLDTYPVGSGTSASDCLWAGCPLLMLAGEIMYARMCGGILKAANLEQMITYSNAEYEAKAIYYANHKTELDNITHDLRAKRNSLPLFDTPKFVKQLERAYTAMHKRAKQGLTPISIEL